MKSKRKSCKERICALLIALAMVLTGVMPSGALTANAAPGALTDVEFTVRDASSRDELSNLTITVKDKDNQEVGKLTLPNEEHKNTISLTEGETYAYEIVKNGYNTVEDEFTVKSSDEENQIRVWMTMSAIEIELSGNLTYVGDTAKVSVKNPVAGAQYSWRSSNPNVVSVDANGNVEAVGKGSAQITASYNGKTSNRIEVSPEKRDLNIALEVQINRDKKNNPESATFKVTGLPTDVNDGKVTFRVNGNDVNTADVKSDTVEWTYAESEKLIGKVVFGAVYAENKKYSESTAPNVEFAGLDWDYDLIFEDSTNSQENPKLVTKDIESKDKEVTFNIKIDRDSLKNRTLSYKSSNEDILQVDNEGKVTVVGNGEAYITVTAGRHGNYLETEKNYYVYSQKPVDVSKLNLSATPVTDRIYDGTTKVQIIAVLSQADLESLGIFTGDLDTAKGLIFKLTGDIASADVQTAPYSAVTVKSVDDILATTADGDEVSVKDRIEAINYEGAEFAASVTVVQRTVFLGARDYKVIYRKENVIDKLSQSKNMVYAVEADEDTGIVNGDSVDMTAFRATCIYGRDYEYVEEVYDSAIIPNMETVEDTTNYHFEISQEHAGTLTVLREEMTLEEMLDSITFSAEGGTVYSDEDGNMWVSGGTLKASFTDSGVGEYYNKIILTVREGWRDREYNLCEEGYELPEENTEIEAELRLQKNTFPPSKTPDRDFTFTVDTTEPDFTFGEWAGKTQVSDTWLGAITFNNYQKTEYSIEGVKWDDDKSDRWQESITQSGVKEWEYYIYKVDTDDQLTEENLKQVAQTAVWTEGSGDSIPVITGENGELKTVQGNYIVLVKIKDNVDNTAIYSSNGVVLDVTDPSIAITQADGTAINENTYYNDAIDYKVTLTDGTISSGLDRAVVKLFDGEEEIRGERQTVEIDDRNVNSMSEEGYTLSEIKERSQYTITGTIDRHSNNLRLEVTVYDQAGNSFTDEQSLKIDLKAPKIKVSYNNDTDVKNERYFNTDRVMTVKYEEKNFDKSGITFDVKAGADIDSMILSENVSLSELSSTFGIKVGEIEDSQSERDIRSYDDDRVNTLTLTFSKDKEYYIAPHYSDLAGNTEDGDVTYNIDKDVSEDVAEIIKNEFVIDKTDPVINVTYMKEGGSVFVPKTELFEDGDRAYSTKAVTATVTIDEKNFYLEEKGEKAFAADQFSFEGTNGVDSSDQNIKDVKAEDYLKVAEKTEDTNWSTVGYVRTNGNFIFSTDANYTFTFTYTDLAGNTVTYNSAYFTVDKPETDAPKGTISLDKEGSIWDKVWKAITFNIFRNDSYQVDIDGTDDISGVKSIEYFKTPDPISEDTNMEGLNWRTLDVTGEKPARGGSFTVSPNEQFVVYEKITDYAGNVTYIYPTNGAVADDTRPEINVTCTNQNAARNGIFNEDVHFSVSVKDRVAGDTYSGIKRVWYTVTAGGNVANAITEEDPAGRLFTAKNEADLIQNNKVRNATFTIPAASFNSNDVKVQVHAEDLSGNISHSEVIPIKIDITAPTINVTYDLNNPSNGRYYNATRTATVTVTERNFDPSAVRFNITNTDGTQPSISGWSHSAGAGVSDSATHTCTVTFAADGDYTFTLNTTDLAGNTSSYGRVDEFTIDQTDPTIQVSYDNNNDAEPGYFNASRTATVTINEHNFNAADVNAMITASLQGSGASAPGLSGWTTRGDSHTATVTFSSDADYTFDIDYTDLAGNAAADYTLDSFTVDQTAPEIEFFDITDKSANKGEVAPGVRYSDINYTESGVEITLTGANNGDESVDGIRSSIPNGQSIKLEDFAHEKEVDDLYTMTAVVTDRAGNDTEQSVMFSVNRFGSVYVMSTDTQELLDKVYTNEEQDLVVTEINVDSLVFNGISSGRDGNLTTLTEGEDYTVRESGAEDSWKQYTYTIDKENFETEGNYTVTIESEDQAENLSSTQVKKVQSPTDETQLYELEFAVDKTAPTVVLTGIEDGGQYRSNVRDVTVNTSDNIAMGDVKVYLGNSDEATTFSAEDIQAADGELTYTIPSSNTRQDIRAVATDAAGNTSETEINRVLVTSNLFVQFYSNTPLLAGSIAGVVVIAAALWYFLIFKRKKDEEKQANRR